MIQFQANEVTFTPLEAEGFLTAGVFNAKLKRKNACKHLYWVNYAYDYTVWCSLLEKLKLFDEIAPIETNYTNIATFYALKTSLEKAVCNYIKLKVKEERNAV